MTPEDKKLLLQDLCARLPYGVICQIDDGAAGFNDGKLAEINISEELARFDVDYCWKAYIDDIKPYLRPMSSMTEEEKSVLLLCNAFIEPHSTKFKMDFYNQHYLDYRDLIEKGLALEAPKGMYKA